MNKNFILVLPLLFFFLFSLTFVSAQPTFTTINFDFDDGLIIVDSPQTYLKQGQNYTINFFVYNKSDGFSLDNSTINCTYYLANNLGELVYNSPVEYNSEDYWDEFISEDNFTRIGEYNYGINCQGIDVGGATVGTLIVTPSGQGGTENTIFFLFIIVLIYGITFFGFFGKNIPMTILGGMAMIFLGVYLVNHGIIIFRDDLTNYIAYLTIGMGAITSFWAILEQLEVF